MSLLLIINQAKMAQSLRNEVVVLHGMFPSWDVELLEELLEAHQGDVERTVDSLLAMNAIPSVHETETAQTSAAPTRRQHNTIPPLPSSPRGKQYSRIKLPDDFLRLPMDECRALSDQEERDAIMARMLQDQFFRDEVLSSEEFSSHFHSDRTMRQSQAYLPEKTTAEIASATYTSMSEKFTTMSEAMKNKMHDMYMRFQMRNDASASRDPNSKRPLMASDSDSSEDEDLNDSPDVRRRNMGLSRSQESPRQWSSRNTTGKSDTGTGSKKDD